MTILIFKLFLLAACLLGTCENNCQNGSLSKYVLLANDESPETTFYNFDSFSQLLTICHLPFNASLYVAILPKNPLVIKKDWQIHNIIKADQIDRIFEIKIANIKGIDIKAMSYLKTDNNFEIAPFIALSYITLDIYLGEEKIDAKSQCNFQVFSNEKHFFQFYTTISFETVKYPPILCPLLFRNSKVTELMFFDIYNSFLIRNKLTFYKFNDSSSINDLHTDNLRILYLVVYKIDLNSDILHKQLFKNLCVLSIFNSLNRIEQGLLTRLNFESLNEIIFCLDNFREIFHQGNKWLADLNAHLKVNLNDVYEVRKNYKYSMVLAFGYRRNSVSFDTIYTFPNEDICLFKDFPHDRLVYPVIVPGEELTCTCTLKWIQMFIHLYAPRIVNFTYDYSVNYANNVTMPFTYSKTVYKYCHNKDEDLECDFEKIFKNCKSVIHEEDQYSHFRLDNDADVLFFIKWLQFIILVILQPILSLLGILMNILSIACIKNTKKKKDFASPMYAYILVNCHFNIVFCILMILRLINTCLFPLPFESIYCSSVFLDQYAQYFKIIFILYLGNVFKLCTNLSYFGFTFSRFILAANLKDKKWCKRFLSLSLRKYSILTIALSSIMSLFVLFQYRINSSLDVRKEFPFEIRDEIFCLHEANQFECTLFNSFKIIYKSLNDIVFFVLVLAIDLCLLRSVQKDLEKKSKQFTDQAHRDEILQSSKNINRMVVTNGVVYVLAHLPEFLITILIIAFSSKLANFCEQNLSCDLINEEAGFFSLISITGQFFIFLKFNKTFKESFYDFTSRFRKQSN
jgi:hypothetical protein